MPCQDKTWAARQMWVDDWEVSEDVWIAAVAVQFSWPPSQCRVSLPPSIVVHCTVLLKLLLLCNRGDAALMHWWWCWCCWCVWWCWKKWEKKKKGQNCRHKRQNSGAGARRHQGKKAGRRKVIVEKGKFAFIISISNAKDDDDDDDQVHSLRRVFLLAVCLLASMNLPFIQCDLEWVGLVSELVAN